jgi:hypothetical protein
MSYIKNIFKNIHYHYKKYKNILNFQNNYNIILIKYFFDPLSRRPAPRLMLAIFNCDLLSFILKNNIPKSNTKNQWYKK